MACGMACGSKQVISHAIAFPSSHSPYIRPRARLLYYCCPSLSPSSPSSLTIECGMKPGSSPKYYSHAPGSRRQMFLPTLHISGPRGGGTFDRLSSLKFLKFQPTPDGCRLPRRFLQVLPQDIDLTSTRRSDVCRIVHTRIAFLG